MLNNHHFVTGRASESETKQKVTAIHELKEKLKKETEQVKETKNRLREVQDRLRGEKEVGIVWNIF